MFVNFALYKNNNRLSGISKFELGIKPTFKKNLLSNENTCSHFEINQTLEVVHDQQIIG